MVARQQEQTRAIPPPLLAFAFHFLTLEESYEIPLCFPPCFASCRSDIRRGSSAHRRLYPHPDSSPASLRSAEEVYGPGRLRGAAVCRRTGRDQPGGHDVGRTG